MGVGRREGAARATQDREGQEVTNASGKMELIGDLAKSQFSGVVGGENGG